MLLKDLLILFQAGNEGVINVLGEDRHSYSRLRRAKRTSEHYFEMSKYDAEEALSIYRNFCSQTERVVEYLGVAKKLQNLLNVPVPNLKYVGHKAHALCKNSVNETTGPSFPCKFAPGLP